jgi:hypothetical protein
MENRGSLRKSKGGQFVIVATLVAIVLIISLTMAYSFATVFRVKLIRESFAETILRISLDFRQSVAAALASSSARWRLGYVDYEEMGNAFLLSWAQSMQDANGGIGLYLRMEPFPVEFMHRRLINRGESRVSAELRINVSGYGFYGWRDAVMVSNTISIYEDSLERSGDYVSFKFSFTREGGQPISDLRPGNIAVYMREEGAIRKVIDPSRVSLEYTGGGNYTIRIATGTYELVNYNLETLILVVDDMPESYFKDPTYQNVTIEELITVQDQVEGNNWNGGYSKLANDIRPKLDPKDQNTWVTSDADTGLALMLIDETLGYMLPTFELMVFDRRGIVTACYIRFEEAGDTIGPDVKELTFYPSPLMTRAFLKPGSVVLRALIDDTETGNSAISAAEYFREEEGEYGKGTPMSAEDGTFDTAEEWAIATIDITRWEVGDYKFYVHGKDAKGNWGPMKLILLRIRDLSPPSIGTIEPYLDKAIYPEGYSFKNGTLGSDRLQVNVTNISDVGSGDANITVVQCRLRNDIYSTPWMELQALDGQFDEVTEDATGQISLAGVPPGVYNLEVMAVDSFGNIGYSGTQVKVTPDSIGPTLEGAELSPYFTYGDPVLGKARAKDIGNAGYFVEAIQYSIQNASYKSGWVEMSASDGAFDEREEEAQVFIGVKGLNPGVYKVSFRALDSGGNIGQALNLTFQVLPDTLGPEVRNIRVGLIPENRTIEVSAIISDVGKGSSQVALAQMRLYNSTYDTGWLNMDAKDGAYDGPEEYVLKTIDVSTLSYGYYTVEVGAQDILGNKAENQTILFLIEFIPPRIHDEAYVYKSLIRVLSVEANVTDEESPIAWARCRLNNGSYSTPWSDMEAVKGSFSADKDVRVNGSISLLDLRSGDYTLEIEGYDSGGNRGSLTRSLCLDLEGPELIAPNIIVQYSFAQDALNITAFVSDIGRGNSNITGTWCRISGHGRDTGWLNMDAKDGAYDKPEEYAELIVSTQGWPRGFYTVSVGAADAWDNMSNATVRALVGGWLMGWEYRKAHEILGSTAGSVTNYPVKIVVHYGSGSDALGDVYLGGKGRTDFGDIRFTGTDGKTLLDYWIEYKEDSKYAVIWVKVPEIPKGDGTGSTTIYLYYGNPSATSQSDITKVLSNAYTKHNLAFAWTERVSSIDVANGDDVGSWQVIGFNFPYWREPKTRVYVCSNGFGIFDPTAPNNDDSNSLTELRQRWMIAPFWDDLRTDVSGGIVTAPGVYIDRYSDFIVITWEVTRYGASIDSIRFQAILYRNGDIRFNINGATNFNNFSPTLGISKGDGTNYIDLTSERGSNKSWLLTLRNYISPEPSHGAWGPEETYSS